MKNGKTLNMEQKPNEKQDVPVELLDYAKSNFDLYASDLNHLDNKAIGILGITGLLVSLQAASMDNIACLFSSIANGKWSCLICFGMLAFIVYAVSLVFCIIFALRSFQIKQFDYPSDVMELVERFRKIGDTAKLKVDIVKAYANSTKDIEKKNDEKAKHLKYAVWSIFVAVLALLIFSGFSLIHKSYSNNRKGCVMCNSDKNDVQGNDNHQPDNHDDIWDSSPPPPQEVQRDMNSQDNNMNKK